jgi:hypothetical protein
MMIPVIRTTTTTEVVLHTFAGFCLQVAGHILVKLTETPGFLYRLRIAEMLALTTFPCCRVDGRTMKSHFGLKPIGLIMQATFAQLTVVIETKFISIGDIFVF